MNGIFYVAMAQANLSVDWAKSFCSEMSSEWRGMCYSNSASRLIEVDSRNIEKALGLCEAAIDEVSSAACYDELFKYSGYTFTVGSPEFFELCNGMPSPWSDKCLIQSSIERL